MIFGSKSDRDMKQIKPILEKVLAAYPAIDKLSNDELRAHSEALKARIREVRRRRTLLPSPTDSSRRRMTLSR